jgi:hypothetical protein
VLYISRWLTSKVVVDVLTEQMTEIDKEIRATKSNMLLANPVCNNSSPEMLMVPVASGGWPRNEGGNRDDNIRVEWYDSMTVQK